MKLIHLSDLHLGKRLNEFSMLEDQRYILGQILRIVDQEKPDGVMIAGDIYDKSLPGAEAVQLFDDFLVNLVAKKQKIFVISGNHDSAERLAFASRLLDTSGVYLSPVYDGEPVWVPLEDAYGGLDLFMLPFVRPSQVKRYFPEAAINSYTEAIKTALGILPVNPDRRSILITHQFVTGASRCQSEEISLGGSDNVDAGLFAPFDYVALGHIHSPQNVGRPTLRYCGTPLKYSFSEANHEKSLTLVELKEKGNVAIKTIPLVAYRDLRELKGTYRAVTAKSFYQEMATDDYLHITLTDEADILDAMAKLRVIYPNLMKLDYDNQRTRSSNSILGLGAEDGIRQSPLQLFQGFYEQQNNQPLSPQQWDFLKDLIGEIWEEDQS